MSKKKKFFKVKELRGRLNINRERNARQKPPSKTANEAVAPVGEEKKIRGNRPSLKSISTRKEALSALEEKESGR